MSLFINLEMSHGSFLSCLIPIAMMTILMRTLALIALIFVLLAGKMATVFYTPLKLIRIKKTFI